jgi:uncharacterized membrane protein YeaQ/YmgE (transglycosylase-associated protein family)
VDLRRLFLQALIVSLVATALLAIGVLLLAEFDETTWKIIGTTALLSALSLLAMPAAALLDRDRAVWLAWLTFALAGWGLAHTLYLLWAETDEGGRLLVTVVAFAVAGSQASATTSRLRDDDSGAVATLYLFGVAGSVLAALLVSYPVWRDVEGSMYYRLLAALAVAVVLVTILQPILRRSSRESSPGPRFWVLVTTGDGRTVRRGVDGADFAAAAAVAIREVEASGARVVRLERQ